MTMISNTIDDIRGSLTRLLHSSSVITLDELDKWLEEEKDKETRRDLLLKFYLNTWGLSLPSRDEKVAEQWIDWFFVAFTRDLLQTVINAVAHFKFSDLLLFVFHDNGATILPVKSSGETVKVETAIWISRHAFLMEALTLVTDFHADYVFIPHAMDISGGFEKTKTGFVPVLQVDENAKAFVRLLENGRINRPFKSFIVDRNELKAVLSLLEIDDLLLFYIPAINSHSMNYMVLEGFLNRTTMELYDKIMNVVNNPGWFEQNKEVGGIIKNSGSVTLAEYYKLVDTIVAEGYTVDSFSEIPSDTQILRLEMSKLFSVLYSPVIMETKENNKVIIWDNTKNADETDFKENHLVITTNEPIKFFERQGFLGKSWYGMTPMNKLMIKLDKLNMDNERMPEGVIETLFTNTEGFNVSFKSYYGVINYPSNKLEGKREIVVRFPDGVERTLLNKLLPESVYIFNVHESQSNEKEDDSPLNSVMEGSNITNFVNALTRKGSQAEIVQCHELTANSYVYANTESFLSSSPLIEKLDFDLPWKTLSTENSKDLILTDPEAKEELVAKQNGELGTNINNIVQYALLAIIKHKFDFYTIY